MTPTERAKALINKWRNTAGFGGIAPVSINLPLLEMLVTEAIEKAEKPHAQTLL